MSLFNIQENFTYSNKYFIFIEISVQIKKHTFLKEKSRYLNHLVP